MTSTVLAHHLDLGPDDRKELARLLRRELREHDVHVVQEPPAGFRDQYVTWLEITDANRFFYVAAISVQKHNGIQKMVFKRQDGKSVTVDPALYRGDRPLGLDLGAFHHLAPLLIEVHHEASEWELVMKAHLFEPSCPEIKRGSREDLAFRALGPNLWNAYRKLRERGPSGDENLDELLELLPMHLPMLRDLR